MPLRLDMSSDMPTAIERAFALASSGRCQNLNDIRKQLKIEGYGVEQITGPSLVKQLRELIAKAPRK